MLTNEQIKEFWEWCGVNYEEVPVEYTGFPHIKTRPPIDLNNLFKYAMPRIDNFVVKLIYDPFYRHWIASINDAMVIKIGEDKDPALALFLAIRGVMYG